MYRMDEIYAKNGANSCLNLTFSIIPTCKALIGDLQTTVQISKYMPEILENLIFLPKSKILLCPILPAKNSKVSEFCNPGVSSFPQISNDKFQSGATIASSLIHFPPHSWP